MQPQAPEAFPSGPTQGLPSVVPPSGKFIAQLFLVPFLIVATIVLFLLGVNWLVSGSRNPEDFLKKLDDANPDVRWRAAADLAQVLLRDDELASNAKFAADLTQRASRALQTEAGEEKAAGERTKGRPRSDLVNARKARESERAYIGYLDACLGNFIIPVGAPFLSQTAADRGGNDPLFVFQRRRQALWALVNLGKNLQRFSRLPSSQQSVILEQLNPTGVDAYRAEPSIVQAFNYFSGPDSGKLKDLGVDTALATCAEDPNPFLRELTVLALNFWQGRGEENARMETLLVKLSSDDGHGEEILTRFREEESEEGSIADAPVSKIPGATIRYNATVALARRGSDKVRLGLLDQMLDETYLSEHLRIRSKDGRDLPDQALVSQTIDAALKAVDELHRTAPQKDLSRLYPALDALTQNPSAALKNEAERTLIALGKK
jgi:hypothetical protein